MNGTQQNKTKLNKTKLNKTVAVVNKQSDSCVDEIVVIDDLEINHCVDEVFKYYQNNIDPLEINGKIATLLADYTNDLGVNLVKLAIDKAVFAKARNFNYVDAILNNWSKKRNQDVRGSRKRR